MAPAVTSCQSGRSPGKRIRDATNHGPAKRSSGDTGWPVPSPARCSFPGLGLLSLPGIPRWSPRSGLWNGMGQSSGPAHWFAQMHENRQKGPFLRARKCATLWVRFSRLTHSPTPTRKKRHFRDLGLFCQGAHTPAHTPILHPVNPPGKARPDAVCHPVGSLPEPSRGLGYNMPCLIAGAKSYAILITRYRGSPQSSSLRPEPSGK